MFSLSIHSSTGPLDVQVSAPNEPNKIAFLSLITKDRTAEVTIFRSGPLALEQILDLGYEIVNACRKLMPGHELDFGESLEANMPHVPFAINDAIEHEEAMESFDLAKQQGYDPDLAERL